MSAVSEPPVFPVMTLSVESWQDPVIDELGHDPRSAYVERFWLPVLGPSTVWFLRQLADRIDAQPEGFELDLVETAQSLGVGMRGGRHSPMLKTVERSCRFGAARMIGTTGLAVRRRLAPLTRAQTERLPRSLAQDHAQWLQRPRPTTTVDELRDRARSLALSMLELGEDDASIERQLHRWRFHPALASDALRWAREARTALPDPSLTSQRRAPGPSPKVTLVHRPRIGAVGIALRNEPSSQLGEAG
ncbi:MAG: hypothetical protein EBX39_08410 [Actinobacteria bacterium]|nr:hypothetical protein [Actinomycetota bacterium]